MEKEQICSTETKEQACLNETKGLELVRLLQIRRLTYLTKLTPWGMISSSILVERSCAMGDHLLLDVVQLDVGIDEREALAHRRQIDVLVMRTGNRERSVNAKVKHSPCHITCLVRDTGGVNHERAYLLLRGQLVLIADQLDGDT